MQLYPVVDMKNGQCVRLGQGVFKDVTIYPDAPEEMAAHWQEKEASLLHLMGLDGVLADYSVNEEVVRRIANTASIPVETGGGTRSKEVMERMLDLGVRRAIIGIRVAEHPEFLRGMVRTFGEEVIVTDVDVEDGMVAMEGWERVNSLTTSDLCLIMKGYGVRHIVYTDIFRDGMLPSPSVEAIRKLTEETELDITVSGGVSRMEDLKCLHEAGIRGAIIGEALYENQTDLAETVRLYEA